MTRPLLLDLYCGAGGAAMGYHRAGFDSVGVDIVPQPHYPFEFIQGDALHVLWDDLDVRQFAAVHASPPCQDHSMLQNATRRTHGTGHLLADTRELLEKTGLPWVIENVPGADMRPDYKLCGCQFNLPGLTRERWFETSWRGFAMQSPCTCPTGFDIVDVTGHNPQGRIYKARREAGLPPPGGIDEKRAAMGIDWMNRNELSQAIPPAYTEYIGAQLLDAIKAAA
jgi:DNA (cytosine-5)-methyltransferase 1